MANPKIPEIQILTYYYIWSSIVLLAVHRHSSCDNCHKQTNLCDGIQITLIHCFGHVRRCFLFNERGHRKHQTYSAHPIYRWARHSGSCAIYWNDVIWTVSDTVRHRPDRTAAQSPGLAQTMDATDAMRTMRRWRCQAVRPDLGCSSSGWTRRFSSRAGSCWSNCSWCSERLPMSHSWIGRPAAPADDSQATERWLTRRSSHCMPPFVHVFVYLDIGNRETGNRQVSRTLTREFLIGKFHGLCTVQYLQ